MAREHRQNAIQCLIIPFEIHIADLYSTNEVFCLQVTFQIF